MSSPPPRASLISSHSEMDLEQTILQLHATIVSQLDTASTLEAIEAARVDAVGRKGKLNEISKELGKLPPDERKRVGAQLNAVKQDLEAQIAQRKAALEAVALEAKLDSEWV